MPYLFLAYAYPDRDLALKVREDLVSQGLRVWDVSDLAVGSDWKLSILDRLRDAAAIVAVMSDAARKSEWVEREIAYAQTSGMSVVPLLLEGDPLPQLADRQYFQVDPTGSVPRQVIDRLRDLLREADTKAEEIPTSDAARALMEALSQRTIGSVVDEVQGRVVLLLGNFTGRNLDRLSQLQAALEARRYHPVIFNFDRPKSSDFGETIRLLAGLAGFIIADMSDPRSVAMEMQLIAPELSVPIVPIIASAQRPLALFGDFFGKYDWVLPTHTYETTNSLIASLDKCVIGPAKDKQQELRERKAAANRPGSW